MSKKSQFVTIRENLKVLSSPEELTGTLNKVFNLFGSFHRGFLDDKIAQYCSEYLLYYTSVQKYRCYTKLLKLSAFEE